MRWGKSSRWHELALDAALVLGVTALAGPGCYLKLPNEGAGGFRCAQDSDCVQGYACRDGFCVSVNGGGSPSDDRRPGSDPLARADTDRGDPWSPGDHGSPTDPVSPGDSWSPGDNAPPGDPPCIPNCNGRSCGPDSVCGRSCGACGTGDPPNPCEISDCLDGGTCSYSYLDGPQTDCVNCCHGECCTSGQTCASNGCCTSTGCPACYTNSGTYDNCGNWCGGACATQCCFDVCCPEGEVCSASVGCCAPITSCTTADGRTLCGDFVDLCGGNYINCGGNACPCGQMCDPTTSTCVDSSCNPVGGMCGCAAMCCTNNCDLNNKKCIP